MSTIVIVGRKNVGKSTIFNRLTGMRMSVVHREPGVTRDRVYGEIEWCGRMFNVIDTGGFFPSEEKNLAYQISKQIDYGLKEANLIYFVVDGKTGLKPQDEEICQHIRKTNKKIFLLINKVDSKKAKNAALEFSRFGLDNIFSVSAEAGTGFGDVLDESLKVLPEVKKIKKDSTIKILILGRPNAGKSTLLNVITESERAIVDEKPGTTRDLVNAKFTYRNKQMEIIDTCGLRRPSRIKASIEFYSTIRAVNVIEQTDIVILIFDTTQGIVDQDRRIASLILSKAKGFVIAPNKIDLIKKENHQKIVPSTYQSFKSLNFVPVIPISAFEKRGIEPLLNRILDVHYENNKFVEKDILGTIYKNFQPPSNGEIYNLRQIQTRPPVFVISLSTSVRESYIKYIRNSIRHYFGFSGVPVLIKTKVMKKPRKRFIRA
jgi:GTP-binding protein